MMNASASIADSANSGRRNSRHASTKNASSANPPSNSGRVEQPGVARDRVRLGEHAPAGGARTGTAAFRRASRTRASESNPTGGSCANGPTRGLHGERAVARDPARGVRVRTAVAVDQHVLRSVRHVPAGDRDDRDDADRRVHMRARARRSLRVAGARRRREAGRASTTSASHTTAPIGNASAGRYQPLIASSRPTEPNASTPGGRDERGHAQPGAAARHRRPARRASPDSARIRLEHRRLACIGASRSAAAFTEPQTSSKPGHHVG